MNYEYYDEYEDQGTTSNDYYLPQETYQLESERSTRKNQKRHVKKEADEFKWYLHQKKKSPRS